MTQGQKQHRFIIPYVILDYLTTATAWFCFFVYRKIMELGWDNFSWNCVYDDNKFYIGVFLIPLCWLFLFFMWNTYNNILNKSRLKEFIETLKQILIGTIVLFFAVILDDYITDYTDYLKAFAVLFCLHLGFVSLFRLSYITILKNQKRKGKYPIRTVLVGKPSLCEDLYMRLQKGQKENNYQIIGYISTQENNIAQIPLNYLGSYMDIDKIVNNNFITNVIIAVEGADRQLLDVIFSLIVNCRVTLQVLPTKEDHLLRFVKNTAVLQESFIQMDLNAVPIGQQIIKRTMDIICSLLLIVILSPVYLLLAVWVKLTSTGNVFFFQERIGKQGVPFNIIKFRSMYENAEAQGPQLSNKDDGRITPFGRFLRRSHLDELPQFFNVLKGDMTLVGHRPERQYYIDQIIQKAPYYRLLLLEKPGITSWGQVRYGYAENVEQMIERLHFDILYIENKSLLLDVKIIIYTVLNILRLGGK
ncbi:MAG: sugar transferase [Bacteroidales bacterium]|nr:sugar transferase [Bacteroidales bacterium]